jgi:hypothetical protein
MKYMLNKKVKEPICMTWKEDYAKEPQESQSSLEHQNQRSEEEIVQSRIADQVISRKALISKTDARA